MSYFERAVLTLLVAIYNNVRGENTNAWELDGSVLRNNYTKKPIL